MYEYMIESILIPEKVIAKIKTKLFDYNPVESRWYEAPIYKYELIKETKTKTVTGHGKEWSKGNAVIYKINDKSWARETIYSTFGEENQAMKAVFSSNWSEDVIEEEGVLDISKKQIGTTKWDIEVDVAKGLILDVKRNDIINY